MFGFVTTKEWLIAQAWIQKKHLGYFFATHKRMHWETGSKKKKAKQQ